MNIAAVIPLYNNPDTILAVTQHCRQHLDKVVVVDDASTRLPADFEQSLRNLGVTLLRHDVNRGQGAATMTALAELDRQNVDYIITLDADGQHSPDDIPAFLEQIRLHGQNRDVIFVGNRDFNTPNVPNSSKFGRSFSNFWVRLECGAACGDTQSGFRAYPVKPLARLRCLSSRYAFMVEVLVRAVWGGLRLQDIPITVTYQPRETYISHFRPFMDNLRFSLLHTWLVTRRLLPWPHPRLIPKPPRPPYPSPFRHPLQFLRYLLSESATPLGLAVSAAVGTFLAVLPLMSCHMVVILYVCIRLRLNKVMALAIQNLFMPPLSPFLCIELGFFMQHGQFLREATLQTIVRELHLRLLDWLLGSLVLAPLFALLTGTLTYLVARHLQPKAK